MHEAQSSRHRRIFHTFGALVSKRRALIPIPRFPSVKMMFELEVLLLYMETRGASAGADHRLPTWSETTCPLFCFSVSVSRLSRLPAGPRASLHFKPKEVRAAVVTCGGLCPGLNSVIHHLVLTLLNIYGAEKVCCKNLRACAEKPPRTSGLGELRDGRRSRTPTTLGQVATVLFYRVWCHSSVGVPLLRSCRQVIASAAFARRALTFSAAAVGCLKIVIPLCL